MGRVKLILLSALLSFATGAESPPLRLNPDLVRPWSSELAAEAPFRFPFLATFEKDGFVLAYIAAAHGTQESSSTMTLIRKTLENGPFQAVMIEGFPFDASSADKDSYLEAVKKGRAHGAIENGEPAYTAILAHSQGIPFYGGEPGAPEALRNLRARGYETRDMLGFEIVRSVEWWDRQGKLGTTPLEKLAGDSLARLCRKYLLSPSECPDWTSFRDWYRSKNGKEFGKDFDKIEAEPKLDGQYFTQRLSSAVDDVRNKATVAAVEALILRHRRILVVYGGSHLAMQQRAFEAALGAPSYSH